MAKQYLPESSNPPLPTNCHFFPWTMDCRPRTQKLFPHQRLQVNQVFPAAFDFLA